MCNEESNSESVAGSPRCLWKLLTRLKERHDIMLTRHKEAQSR
jgi:hypothetical protein